MRNGLSRLAGDAAICRGIPEGMAVELVRGIQEELGTKVLEQTWRRDPFCRAMIAAAYRRRAPHRAHELARGGRP